MRHPKIDWLAFAVGACAAGAFCGLMGALALALLGWPGPAAISALAAAVMGAAALVFAE